jgi:hypothetical protein
VLLAPSLAVRVYGIVASGDIFFVPLAATMPMPWSMDTVLAPVTVQLKVVTCPEVMLAGFTSKLLIARVDTGVVAGADPQPGPAQTASTVITVSNSHPIFIMLLLYDLSR